MRLHHLLSACATALMAGCETVSFVPDACAPEAAPADGTDRDRVVAALDHALPGRALDTPSTWADGRLTMLTLTVALDPSDVQRLESPCHGETTGWTAPVEVTLATADGRLDEAITAVLTLGSLGDVTLQTPPPALDATTLAALGIPGDATLHIAHVHLTSPSPSPARNLMLGWTLSDAQADSDHATVALTW